MHGDVSSSTVVHKAPKPGLAGKEVLRAVFTTWQVAVGVDSGDGCHSTTFQLIGGADHRFLGASSGPEPDGGRAGLSLWELAVSWVGGGRYETGVCSCEDATGREQGAGHTFGEEQLLVLCSVCWFTEVPGDKSRLQSQQWGTWLAASLFGESQCTPLIKGFLPSRGSWHRE